MLNGEYKDLTSRGLTADTLRRFGYKLALVDGTPVHIAPYYSKQGEIVAQKLRYPEKKIRWTGEKDLRWQLFGQQAWGAGGHEIIVTEGEIDAMTVSQLKDNKWPVVSVPDGAGASKKAIEKNLDYLESFDRVVFMFDADEPGREGAKECASVLSPGKAYIANLPDGTDPNDLLMARQGAEVQKAIFNAQPFRPDSILSMRELISRASKPVEWGASVPFETLNEMSFGTKPGQLWIGGAGVGIGKTDVFTEMEAHDLQQGRTNIIIHLEQSPEETVRRIASKLSGKPFFRPDFEYTEGELLEVMEPYLDQCYVYDHAGSTEWRDIKAFIRFAAKAYGASQIYVDNLTVLAADADDERRFLDSLLKDMKSMASNLQATVHVLSHLSTPDGTPHEEGGQVQARQMTGSRAIMRYADLLWALERNTQHENEDMRQFSRFRILKDRLTGQSTGKTFWLKYVDGKLLECPAPEEEEEGSNAEDYGF